MDSRTWTAAAFSSSCRPLSIPRPNRIGPRTGKNRLQRQREQARSAGEHRDDPAGRNRFALPNGLPQRRPARVRRWLLTRRPVDRLPARGPRSVWPLPDAARRRRAPHDPAALELQASEHRLGPTHTGAATRDRGPAIWAEISQKRGGPFRRPSSCVSAAGPRSCSARAFPACASREGEAPPW